MPVQKEIDKKLIENLITSRKTGTFVRKYRELIFNVIDNQNSKMGSTIQITPVKRAQLMTDFIDNLLSKSLFENYLHPKEGLNIPLLSIWIHKQCVSYFTARFIIDGILSKNIDVIKTFFFSPQRPGCREMFSKWIYENEVYKKNSNLTFQEFVDLEIRDYVSILYAGIDKFLKEEDEIRKGERKRHSRLEEYENAELTSLAHFSYKGNFYSYFRDYVMAPYLRRKYFDGSVPDINIDDNGEKEDKEQQLEIASPIDLSREHNVHNLLEQIFNIMKRTEAGRRQVEVLRLLNLETFDGEMPTDEEIAKMLDISVANLRTIHCRGLDTAREIAKTLKMY